MTGLVYSNGAPVKARDVAMVRARASLGSGHGPGRTNPYAYDAANPFNSDTGNWWPTLRSADSEINFDRDRITAKARDLVRNDGWAKGTINRLLDIVVGGATFPVPKPNWRALARRYGSGFDSTWASEFSHATRSEYNIWADGAGKWNDFDRTQNAAQQYFTAARAMFLEGDSLAKLCWDPDRVGTGAGQYATCLQLIDPDRLSNPFRQIDNATLRGGVVLRGTTPIGYQIQEAHDYDWWDQQKQVTWKFHPRETPEGRPVMIHHFHKERANQHRGTGIITEGIERYHGMNRQDKASLKAALLRATVGFFITSARDEGEVAESLGAGDSGFPPIFDDVLEYFEKYPTVNSIDGVRMPVMPPGEKPQVVSGGSTVDDYEAVMSNSHRYLAATTGMSTPAISNDFSKLNYSSFRGEEAQAFRTIKRMRREFHANFCAPVYTGLLWEIVDRFPELLPRGVSPDLYPEMQDALAAALWIGPARGYTDPVKEPQGELLGLDACTTTLEQVCADHGMYYQDVLDQRMVEEEDMKNRGLRLPPWTGTELASVDDKKPQVA